MSSQIACLKRYIVTLVAFVWLFSTVCFQMSPQSAGLRWCKVTLIGFVRRCFIMLWPGPRLFARSKARCWLTPAGLRPTQKGWLRFPVLYWYPIKITLLSWSREKMMIVTITMVMFARRSMAKSWLTIANTCCSETLTKRLSSVDYLQRDYSHIMP